MPYVSKKQRAADNAEAFRQKFEEFEQEIEAAGLTIICVCKDGVFSHYSVVGGSDRVGSLVVRRYDRGGFEWFFGTQNVTAKAAINTLKTGTI